MGEAILNHAKEHYADDYYGSEFYAAKDTYSTVSFNYPPSRPANCWQPEPGEEFPTEARYLDAREQYGRLLDKCFLNKKANVEEFILNTETDKAAKEYFTDILLPTLYPEIDN